ncbi:Dcp2, box A domain-containing protein [Schizophyllum commune]
MSSGSSTSSSPVVMAAQASSLPSNAPHIPNRYATHEDVIEDLSSRFILNLPPDELESLERVSFQVEQAHWYYEDFIREQNPSLPSLHLKKFSHMLFHECEALQQWSGQHEEAYKKFLAYKTQVPVCGAIMLNSSMDKCVLVKGWKQNSAWSYPKGKINETEPTLDCAIREVLEETGYDITSEVDKHSCCEINVRGQQVALFVVPGVPEDFPFETRTRKEIGDIKWFRLTDLPGWRKNSPANPKKFYLTQQFNSHLKRYINAQPRSRKAARPIVQPSPHYPYATAAGLQKEVSPESSSQDSGGEYVDPQTPPQQPPPAEPRIANTDQSNDLNRLLQGLMLGNGSPKAAPALPANGQTTADDRKAGIIAAVLGSAENKTQASSTSSATPSPRITESHTARTSPEPSSGRSETVPVSAPTPVPQRPAQPASPAVSTSATTVSANPRRTNNLADISPYLSRASATEVVTAKRLKQLALLESVADESARMVAARMTPAPPPLSTSVPAQAVLHGPSTHSPMTGMGAASSLLYSSAAGPTATPAPHHSPYMAHAQAHPYALSQAQRSASPYVSTVQPQPRHPIDMGMDLAQVRAQTSQSFRHGAPNAALHPAGTQSMSQSQLLSIMNGTSGGLPPSRADSLATPYLARQPPYLGHRPSYPPTTSMQQGGHPLAQPYAFPPPPLSHAPSTSTLPSPMAMNYAAGSVVSPAPSTANPLLSILNGGPAPPVSRML